MTQTCNHLLYLQICSSVNTSIF